MRRLFFFVFVVPLVLCILLVGPLQAISAPLAPFTQDTAPADDLIPRIDEIKSTWLETRASFNADDGQWDTSSGETDTRFFDTGTYHLRVDKTQTVAWSAGPFTASDFYLETTVYPVAGPVNNEFGIISRMVDNDNFYLFTISSDGYYRLRKIVDNEWEMLVDWTASDAIDQGEKAPNVLGVLAEGSQLSLLVNGTALATVDDDTFDQGGLAVAVSTLDEDGVEMAFEDFTLWQPGGEPIETATPEPVDTETPEPEPTVEPQVLLDQVDAIRQADPDYTADFRRPNEDWPTSSSDKATIEYADRAFVITVDKELYSTWSSGNATAQLDLADYYMEADVTQEEGPDESAYGLLARFQDDKNFYFFGITGTGNFAFWKLVDNEWEVISNWRHSEAIRASMGDTNRLGILSEGNRFALFANDELLAQVVDNTFSTGNVGLYAETQEAGGVKVSFDNIDVWKTSAAPEPPADETPESPTAVPTEAVETPEHLDVEAIQLRVDEIKTAEATTTDDFRRDTGAWETGDDEDADVGYANRALRIEVKHPDWLTWSDGDLTLGDFLLEVDVTDVSSDADGQVGLLFRKVDDENYYFYGVTPAGDVGLWKKVADEWQNIVDWTATDAAVTETDDIRRLGVLAEGPVISLLIDGTPVAQVEDSEFSEGGIALVSSTFDAPTYTAEFDNLSVWELGE